MPFFIKIIIIPNLKTITADFPYLFFKWQDLNFSTLFSCTHKINTMKKKTVLPRSSGLQGFRKEWKCRGILVCLWFCCFYLCTYYIHIYKHIFGIAYVKLFNSLILHIQIFYHKENICKGFSCKYLWLDLVNDRN